jgi:hypothetical protein
MPRTVDLRIENHTGLDLDSVRVVLPGGGEIDFGPVAQGGATGCHQTDTAYRYAEVHARAGDRALSFQPVDYLGERPLPTGRYSYVIGVEGGQLVIRIKPVE